MNVITTKTAQIFLLKPGLVKMVMKEDAVLELEDMIENHTAENAVSENQPHAILIDTRLNSMSNDEARKFSSGLVPAQYRIASAILFKGLAGRIGANSLVKNYQPKVPTQTFADEAEALRWLDEMLNSKKD